MRLLNKNNYKTFTSWKDAERWGRKSFPQMVLNLNNEDWYDAFSYYKGQMADWINQILRKHKVENCTEYFQSLNKSPNASKMIANTQKGAILISNVLAQSIINENIVVHRYLKIKHMRKLTKSLILKRGMIFSDYAILSTTLVESQMMDFIKENNCNCVLHIYVPAGTHGVYIPSEYETDVTENEMLLPPNSKLRIVDIKYNLFNKIRCEVACVIDD